MVQFLKVPVNPLPNDKILDWSKFNALTDDKINVTRNLKFVLDNVENILGKGRKCWLKKPLFSESLKVGIVW